MTNLFVQMCNHPKIQKGWKPEVGDAVIEKRIKNPEMLAIVESIEPNDIHAQVVVCKIGKYRATKPIRKRYLIFLPSTDQIAEMWGEANSDRPAYDFLGYLRAFMQSNLEQSYWDINWPVNIIALHFYMSDVHGLKWVEKGWE